MNYLKLCNKTSKNEINFILLFCTDNLIIINMNEYFSTFIKRWCNVKLKKLNYDFLNVNVKEILFNHFRSHRTIYIQLKTIILNHIINENVLKLTLCTQSTKKIDNQQKTLYEKTKQTQMIKTWILSTTKYTKMTNCLQNLNNWM